MIHNDASESMKAGTLTGYGSTDNAFMDPRRVLYKDMLTLHLYE